MISTSILIALVIIGIGMFVYSIIDNRHPYYGNIAVALIAALIELYCSAEVGAGGVYDKIQCTIISNSTTTISTNCVPSHIISDLSLSLLLQYAGICMLAYILLMAAMAYINHRKEGNADIGGGQ